LSSLGARALYLGQSALIGAGILLGAIWPSVYTFIALFILPAFVLSLAATIKPTFLRARGGNDRRWLTIYTRGALAVTVGMFVFQAVWIVLLGRGLDPPL
jgi:hypothetical protein